MNATIDEVLDRMRGASPEHANGIPNHGPMAAEALTALGCAGGEVVKWADRYSKNLIPMPAATSRITHESWRESLGKQEATGDWFAFFREELAEHSWQTVLDRWLSRLLPGIMAAGTHGFIRTAHAVRALGDAQTQLRVEELATALGYWAAFYQELPGHPVLSGDLSVDQALDRVPRVGQGYDATLAVPREFVQTLDYLPGFSAAVTALTPPDSISNAITSLTRTAAHYYLASADRYPIVMLHTVTGPSALRMLLPHLTEEVQRTAFAYIWQAVVGWVAAFSAQNGMAPENPYPALTISRVLERCLETGDPHAIKFVEACLRENAVDANPVYLAAAQDWAIRLREATDWTTKKKIFSGLLIRQ